MLPGTFWTIPQKACKLSNNSVTITLTRKQIELIITHMALDQGIDSVTIFESHGSGIGASHRTLFNKRQIERSFETDITDVGVW